MRLALLAAVCLAAPLLRAQPAPVSPDARLVEAAAAGDPAALLEALAEGADPDAPDASGYAALHWAVGRGYVAVAALLLERGAQQTAPPGGYSPLALAAHGDDALMARLLLCHGAAPVAADTMGAWLAHAVLTDPGAASCPPGLAARLVEAGRVRDEATRHRVAGRYAEAAATYAAAAEALGGALPSDAPVLLSLRENEGVARYVARDLDGARSLFDRSLAAREARFGPDHPALAFALINRGALAVEEGAYAEARPLLERALALLGGDAAVLDLRTTTLGHLGTALQLEGLFSEARRHFERAVAELEAGGEGRRLGLAQAVNNLADLLMDQGDVGEATRLYERSLALRLEVLGPDHPDVARAVNNYGAALHGQADATGDAELYARALALYEQALAGWEATLGPDHPEVARALINVASVRIALGDADAAVAELERALAVFERAGAGLHADVALLLGHLAAVHVMRGAYPAAAGYAAQASGAAEAAMGPGHPYTTGLRMSEALYGALAGRPEAALLAVDAARATTAFAERTLPVLSVAEQRAFTEYDLPQKVDVVLTLVRSGALTGYDLADAYDELGRWKGALLHGLRRQTAAARLAGDPAHADDVARLQALREEIAALHAGAGDPATADALAREREALERRLAAALPDGALEDPLGAVGVGALGSRLRPDEAFVDVYRYRDAAYGAARYAAFALSRGGYAVLDLGPAAVLDSLVAAWRATVTRGAPADTETAALARALWAPLASSDPLDGATRVWVSPDGPLARIPWSTLAEAHPPAAGLLVAEIASARDLARLVLARGADAAGDAAAGGVLLVGGVDFGDEGGRWAALPGTETEVEALAALAAEAALPAVVLTDAEPTPAAVAAAFPAARYAHLATHGFFFATDEAAAGPSRSEVIGAAATAVPSARSPLAESGLALAGANAGPEGTLTAEQLVGLDLPRTRLVVLSACETGRGTEVTGQGVLGLRASLQAAGTRAVLMSLWKVPDASTAALMAHFYRALWGGGLAPAEALRAAQAAVRATPGWEAPVHWAAWVLSGEGW